MIPATFYVTGTAVSAFPGLVRAIVAGGHELGAHSWDHINFVKSTAAEIGASVSRNLGAINAAMPNGTGTAFTTAQDIERVRSALYLTVSVPQGAIQK